MSLISLKFFIFLCVTFGMYYLLPKKYQWLVLLSASLFFYLNASPYYLIFLLVSAVTTYAAGIFISRKDGKEKIYLISCLVINIGILCFVKYASGFTDFINKALSVFNLSLRIPEINVLFPLGISFYTFMVISYIVDVYRGDLPETDFFKYLLFVCWFPQIIEGPINVYSKMKETLYKEKDFDFEHCINAGYRILKGLFKKVVIAGRFSVYVDTVYTDINAYGGLTLLCTAVFYVIQLYADFSGCMDMVLGISELFGVTMEENFNLPLFSKSAAEVWKRWHISLGVWFRKYVYDPVFQSGFSKKLKSDLRKTPLKKWSMNIVAAVALSVVWLLTGIWHGDSMKFVFYGAYWGIIIITSMFLAKTYKKAHKTFPKLFNAKWYPVFEIARTLVIITIGFTIFRAGTLSQAFSLFKGVFTRFSVNSASIGEALLPFTGDNTAVAYGLISVLSFLALYVTEIFAYNNKTTFQRHKYVNAAILIVATLLFGVFGQSGFLYMAY